jgi:hypothetical protein
MHGERSVVRPSSRITQQPHTIKKAGNGRPMHYEQQQSTTNNKHHNWN